MNNRWTSFRNSPRSLFREDGNVLVYVLVAVVLFAALSFTLSRQTNTAGTVELDNAKLEFYASDLISYSAQAKSVIDQMMITGSGIDDLDFVKPGESGFANEPHGHKVYHPYGGGLDDKNLADGITVSGEVGDPGWYLTSSMNVEWTDSSSTDVVLTAYQISQPLCALINKKITGSTDIPALSGQLRDIFISTGANNDLTTSTCADCEGQATLCVKNSSENSYGFYSVLAAR